MITGTCLYIDKWDTSTEWISCSGSPHEDWVHWPSVSNRNYFVCENCESRYLLPEIRGTELIRLVCSGCGGRLKEE